MAKIMPAQGPQASSGDLAKARFDFMRKRASGDVRRQVDSGKEQIDRRFAAMGGLNSGANVKAQLMADKQGLRATQEATEAIDATESAEMQRQREVEEGRAYGTSERLGSQDFASGEALKGRQYGTSEREASQAYGTKERLGGQEFVAGQAGIERDFQDKWKNKEFGLAKAGQASQQALAWKAFNEGQRQFGEQMKRADLSFDLEKSVQEFNMKMAERESNKKTIFGKAGDLGTKFWDGASGVFTGNQNSILGYAGGGTAGAVAGQVVGGGGGGK